jgi:uncharacterized protein YyaL (SSP411 family)
MSATPHANRLVHEKSPYLLQHAHNPVDWYPWGEEAFARARAENKPIFLSVGYSTCHWCHVMERESFENHDVAAVMNEHFVCIKLDREERPDIDKIYMTAVQATTGSGGWPMSVWLTPDLRPFYCGTYFPPESRWGRPGFRELLLRIAEVWESNQAGILDQAGKITELLRQQTQLGRPAADGLDAGALDRGFEAFRGMYDASYGGFGHAPKFPRPVTLNFLFRYAERTGSVEAREMALHTLRMMGDGGMFDHLGGGFHRYSVDERWLVSHFEKMLYDQAQLLASYVEAYQITGDEFFADVARRTAEYVWRDLTALDGSFYSAEDADSEGVEGKFYVWTRREIEEVLGEQADRFCAAYGVTDAGNWEHGLNVLHLSGKVAGKLDRERAVLLEARSRRVRPHRDEKVISAWNGLMISALAKAGQGLSEGRWTQAAERAAETLWLKHQVSGKWQRTPTVAAVVDDHAFFALGMLDLYEATLDSNWLVRCRELTDEMLQRFHDADAGGFFMDDGSDASVLVRVKEDYDGAEPSGNSVAAMLLLRLAQMTESEAYRRAGMETLQLFADHMRRLPHGVPQMLCALDFAVSVPKQIVVAGRDTEEMLRVIHQRYRPNSVLMAARDCSWIKDVTRPATAYVCVNGACQLPTTDSAELERLLSEQPAHAD